MKVRLTALKLVARKVWMRSGGSGKRAKHSKMLIFPKMLNKIREHLRGF